jgi:hypothetical protein
VLRGLNVDHGRWLRGREEKLLPQIFRDTIIAVVGRRVELGRWMLRHRCPNSHHRWQATNRIIAAMDKARRGRMRVDNLTKGCIQTIVHATGR